MAVHFFKVGGPFFGVDRRLVDFGSRRSLQVDAHTTHTWGTITLTLGMFTTVQGMTAYMPRRQIPKYHTSYNKGVYRM